MKILYVTTIGTTMMFFKKFIEELLQEGNIVDIACNTSLADVPECYREWKCNIYQLDCSRSPLNRGNINAIRQIEKLVSENQYDIVHCHTPVAAMCTRIACRKARRNGTKVFYTAHGFHFYKGAPLKNWLLYYPVEKLCAYWTDVLITINQEDYILAQKKMSAKQIEYVPGVGIDLQRFETVNIDLEAKRKEFEIPNEAIVLLSVGELNTNKNHETVIRAIADMKEVYYLIAGKGELQEYLQNIIDDLGITNRVRLLGFRNDIDELCVMSDIFCFPSYREGLGLAAIEGMASGLPLIVADNRGTRDYAKNNINALCCTAESVVEFRKAIERMVKEETLRKSMGEKNKKIAKKYDVFTVIELMKELYSSV